MILHLQLWHFDAAYKEEETISSLLHDHVKVGGCAFDFMALGLAHISLYDNVIV